MKIPEACLLDQSIDIFRAFKKKHMVVAKLPYEKAIAVNSPSPEYRSAHFEKYLPA